MDEFYLKLPFIKKKITLVIKGKKEFISNKFVRITFFPFFYQALNHSANA